MTPAELKERRQTLGMSQAKLAAALGITENRYQAWESGRNGIPPFLGLALETLSRRGFVAPPGSLTVREVAALLGMTAPAVAAAIRHGRIAAVKRLRGRDEYWTITRDACEEYLRNHRHTHTAPSYGGRKLTEEQARTILLLRGRRAADEIAAEYGLTRAAIDQLWRGVTWQHLQAQSEEA